LIRRRSSKLQVVHELARVHKVMRGEIAKVIIGQERVIDDRWRPSWRADTRC